MIKNKIQEKRLELKRLSKIYNDLIEKIKDVFYEHENIFDNSSKKKPRTKVDLISAAYCLAMGSAPRASYSVNFTVSQNKSWNKVPVEYFPDFLIYDEDEFGDRSGTKPVKALEKKDLKTLIDICQKIWVKEVSNEFRPKTTLGFDDWLKEISTEELLNLFCEYYPKRVDIVNESRLGIKNIVIVYPHDKPKNYFL